MSKIVNNNKEKESFTSLINRICWNLLVKPPILPEYDGRRLKYGCDRDKEIILRDISCNDCKRFWNNFLKVKRTYNRKSFEDIDDNNRFGLGLEAIARDAPHDIRLKNGLILKLSDCHQDLYPEDRASEILFVLSTYLVYFHFQSYINSENDLKTKVKFRKRMESVINKEFEDEWDFTPSQIYMFHEKYIVTMELNIILYLTGMTMCELQNKLLQCEKRKNKLNQDIIMESDSDDELPDLEFVG